MGDSVFSFRALYHQLLKQTGQLLLLAEGRRDAYRHVLFRGTIARLRGWRCSGNTAAWRR